MAEGAGQLQVVPRMQVAVFTTNASEQCRSACRYMTLVRAGLMHGRDRDEVLAVDWDQIGAITG